MKDCRVCSSARARRGRYGATASWRGARASCRSSFVAGGCVHFQTASPSHCQPQERVVLGARGQLRVIDKNPNGARETVLLVHGYGSSAASYAPVMDALAAHLRVIAIDLPGFGKSDRREGDYTPDALADVLADVLTQKGVQRAQRRRPLMGLVRRVGLRPPPSRPARAPRHHLRLGLRRTAPAASCAGRACPASARPSTPPSTGTPSANASTSTSSIPTSSRRRWSTRSRSRWASRAPSLRRSPPRAACTASPRPSSEYRTIKNPTLLLWGRDDRVARAGFR